MVFLPQEVILKKRNGETLAADDIAQFIAGFAKGTVSHAQAAAFAMAVYFQDMTMPERVALTVAMRDSGTVLDWSDLDGPVADKHSTGGVGDNVSLMLAPILAAIGIYVPMISGRGLGHTGGTLDKFDAIPGYQTSPDNALFRQVVRQAGCAIIGQTADLAPADKTLYAIRDVTGTVESISLITASILSKKLAAGLGALILDVKTGSGAFMPTLEKSRDLAKSLVEVANGAGLKTGALITDMNEPLASAAGNGLEVRNAVDFLTGAHQDWRVREVTLSLCAELVFMTGKATTRDAGRMLAVAALDSGRATERFSTMVHALGGPGDFVERVDAYLAPAPIVRDVFATGQGTVAAIDTRGVGMAVVALGGGRATPTDTIDHTVGFDHLRGIGAQVDGQTPIARIHARDEASAADAEARLKAAYRLGDAGPAFPLIADTIDPTA
ncbi:MAG: thymidine phosphorylase [Alphaproteobacteria bacterium]|jgi:thymidine phosphorylase|nr:thymidine phosphorylase [Alphaproteobacteria bacterium]MBU1563033.1 thymidine phosphorylase [Alphaproteobacteria bacterium]MBU2304228.1 thymidine phosphorylase [Alphaproteobacteria bacterium]MBU2368229.1 thymidine phosphorylase [Alphaproteobacteria bacterium]